MPPPILRALRSTVAGNRPTGRTYGEVYANVADGQFGVINAGAAAQDLLGVSNFQPTANYAQGAAVNYNGQLLTANKALTPSAFNPVNFTSLRRNRNRIVNGDAFVDLFNNWGPVTCTPATRSWGHPCDRWYTQIGITTAAGGGGGSITTQATSLNAAYLSSSPSLLPTTGQLGQPFAMSCLVVKSNVAYAIPASNYVCATGPLVVGQNRWDFAWGTSQAQPVTLSFMVYASQAGTWGGCISSWGYSNPPTNTQFRVYPFTYSVPTANTWTQIAITIPGDTTTPNCWLGTTTAPQTGPASLYVQFDLGSSANMRGTAGAWTTFTRTGGTTATLAGATGGNSLVTTNGAIWAITNVQMEIGSVMSPFDYVIGEDTWLRCYQYYQTNYNGYQPGTDMRSTSLPGIVDIWNWYNEVPSPQGVGATVYLQYPMMWGPNIIPYSYGGTPGAVTGYNGLGGIYEPAGVSIQNLGSQSFWAQAPGCAEFGFYYTAECEFPW